MNLRMKQTHQIPISVMCIPPFIHIIVNEGHVQTINTIESLNMHSVSTRGNLKVEIENCQTILAMEMGVK